MNDIIVQKLLVFKEKSLIVSVSIVLIHFSPIQKKYKLQILGPRPAYFYGKPNSFISIDYTDTAECSTALQNFS